MKHGENLPTLDATTRERLWREAAELLAVNRTAGFTKPSAGQYPHQWNWDSAFIAIGLVHLDPEAAREEIRTLLGGQWRTGMVPHILYPHGASSYFPTPDFWRTSGDERFPAYGTSGLTQPPVLASAVRRMLDVAEGRRPALEFAAEAYPPLLAWHRWLHTARDPEGSGLVAIVHPWESGTDNSTRFAAPLERLGAVRPPPYARGDQRHVDPDERPLQDDYDRFMHLIGLYRELRWDDDAIWREAPFLVRDVLFNSVLHRADDDLLYLAEQLGEPTAEMSDWLAASAVAFESQLWDESAGLYLDFDLRHGQRIGESTCASFMPLYAGVARADRARRLVEAHLLDEREYAPGGGTRYLLPSVSKSSPRFEPRRYWRGPVWLNVNWLLVRGLEAYGFDREAERLRRHTLQLAARSGFVEYYDPRDGSACGASGFSWSAALTLDLLAGA